MSLIIPKNVLKNIPWRPILIVAICILAGHLRLTYLAQHELHGDESLQIAQMQGTFLELLQAPRLFSYLSGDYYLTYPFFKIFSYDKWGLAIPHIISTIIGFYLLYLICRHYLKTTLGFIITFLVVCFNDTMIIHATEIRPYAVLPTLCLASFYVLLRIIRSPAPTRINAQWPAIFILLVTTLFHVYGLMMILLPWAFLLLTHRKTPHFKDAFFQTSRIMLIVLGISLPVYAFSMLGPHVLWHNQGYQTNQYVPYPWEDLGAFLKNVFGNLVGSKKFYILLPGLAIPLFLSFKDRGAQVLLLIIMVIVPIVLLFGMDLKQNYFFVQRQFIWVMPFFALLLGWVWESLFLYLQGNKRS
jgi:4-amino-4-deoxy-L-arabinose transferase-like glycosyltransferase